MQAGEVALVLTPPQRDSRGVSFTGHCVTQDVRRFAAVGEHLHGSATDYLRRLQSQICKALSFEQGEATIPVQRTQDDRGTGDYGAQSGGTGAQSALPLHELVDHAVEIAGELTYFGTPRHRRSRPEFARCDASCGASQLSDRHAYSVGKPAGNGESDEEDDNECDGAAEHLFRDEGAKRLLRHTQVGVHQRIAARFKGDPVGYHDRSALLRSDRVDKRAVRRRLQQHLTIVTQNPGRRRTQDVDSAHLFQERCKTRLQHQRAAEDTTLGIRHAQADQQPPGTCVVSIRRQRHRLCQATFPDAFKQAVDTTA